MQGPDQDPTTEAIANEVSVVKLAKDLNDKKKSDGTWFVYILRCDDCTLYTGITNDLTRRCGQHNAGTASRYTRSRLPVVLVYQEVQASRSDALKRELAIKALSRQEKRRWFRGLASPNGEPTPNDLLAHQHPITRSH